MRSKITKQKMLESTNRLNKYRQEVLRDKLKLKLSKKRQDFCKKQPQKNKLTSLLNDQFFKRSLQKVWNHFDDHELTKIAFKSKKSFMAIQDRKGFVLVHDDKVKKIQKMGKNSQTFFLHKQIFQN